MYTDPMLGFVVGCEFMRKMLKGRESSSSICCSIFHGEGVEIVEGSDPWVFFCRFRVNEMDVTW